MKTLMLAVCVLVLAGCAHLNSYDGPDAALVPVPCDHGFVTAEDGKRYERFIQILTIDESFIGSGQHCKGNYVYRIKPGTKRVKVMSNYVDDASSFERVAFVVMSVDFKPGQTYTLNASYDGQSMEATFTESSTGKLAAVAKTSEVERHALTNNGALQALPFILKTK